MESFAAFQDVAYPAVRSGHFSADTELRKIIVSKFLKENRRDHLEVY
jgi:hypothetical protein